MLQILVPASAKTQQHLFLPILKEGSSKSAVNKLASLRFHTLCGFHGRSTMPKRRFALGVQRYDDMAHCHLSSWATLQWLRTFRPHSFRRTGFAEKGVTNSDSAIAILRKVTGHQRGYWHLVSSVDFLVDPSFRLQLRAYAASSTKALHLGIGKAHRLSLLENHPTSPNRRIRPGPVPSGV